MIKAVESTGGGLCGFIEVSLRDYAEGCQTSPVAYIEGWYVDAESRRHRLGTRLVQAAEAWARRHGLKEIASDTQIENAVSIQAHKVLGYEEVERLVCFRKALDALRVSRRISTLCQACYKHYRSTVVKACPFCWVFQRPRWMCATT